MPNLKIHVEAALYDAGSSALSAVLPAIRNALIRHLAVPQTACHLVLLPVHGLPDQPALSVEVQILPHADRDRACLSALGLEIQAILQQATGVKAAFRCMQHDPASYVVLR